MTENKTIYQKAKDIQRDWYLIDADGKPLGRVAGKASALLLGKHKPTYTPNIDGGDVVVIINAGKVTVTGRKALTKIYHRYSGFTRGMKETNFKEMIVRSPLYPIEKAIKGMLPKNTLARQMLKKLYVFEGTDHPFKKVSFKSVEI